jgi:hypothetical protein
VAAVGNSLSNEKKFVALQNQIVVEHPLVPWRTSSLTKAGGAMS